MKKRVLVLGMLGMVLAFGMMSMGCQSTHFSTNTVGWSNYADVAIKDYETLGVVTVKAEEVHKVGAFHFTDDHTGSNVTYADLLAEAAKLGADDIINVRIDRKTDSSKNLFSFFTGTTETWTYTGSALAIKYTTAAAPDTLKADSLKKLGSSDGFSGGKSPLEQLKDVFGGN
jgi:hypothetical protein